MALLGTLHLEDPCRIPIMELQRELLDSVVTLRYVVQLKQRCVQSRLIAPLCAAHLCAGRCKLILALSRCTLILAIIQDRLSGGEIHSDPKVPQALEGMALPVIQARMTQHIILLLEDDSPPLKALPLYIHKVIMIPYWIAMLFQKMHLIIL